MISLIAEKKAMQHAADNYPLECGGLIIGDVYIELENKAESQENNFIPDPKAIDCEFDVLIHSHTNGRRFPSYQDQLSQISLNKTCGIILTNENGAFKPIYWGDDIRPPLLGRMFIHGVTDCYSIIRDYYWEKGRYLDNFARSFEWWNQEANLYADNFESQGFKVIGDASFTDVKEGDICLMSIRSKKINHAGVYVGDGMILHHIENKLSARMPVDRYIKFIDYWIR